jgi:hypothetical protein
MIKSEHVLLACVVSATLVVVAGCHRQEAAKPAAVVAEDPAAMVARENREIAERLAKQKAEVDEVNNKNRTAADASAASAARAQAAAAIVDMRAKWLGVLRDAGTTQRSGAEPLLARMDAIEAATKALTVPECFEKPRTTLISGISTGLGTYREFMAAKDEPTPDMRRKLADAMLQLERVDSELQACAT